MAQISMPGGSGIGGKIQAIAPLLNLIPGVGPALAAGIGAAGGMKSNSEAHPPNEVSDSAAQRRLEASKTPQISDAQMQQLNDSIKATQQLPPQYQQQYGPTLNAAYDEAMRRRLQTYPQGVA